ncbi:sodium/hydrogen exchanger 9B2 [Xyrauchen texanus]|uniref:sodium/hydrogen exchanger 9B2 n=1 Tax=Xyrauchen texanus TaxID=154827 RepID=UPI002241DD71|nr:sodium/hydrogen exchanger 9B2 [Xyrauchen texanus]
MGERTQQTDTYEQTESKSAGFCSKLQRCPKPHGFIASVITKGVLRLLLFGVVWAVTGPACLPGQNLFGLVVLFLSAVCGGELISVFRRNNTPAIPPLLGMLLAGVVLRNVPYITDSVFIDQKWSSALRNIALTVILTRAGLGLNAAALRRLKSVCMRVAVGPCIVEACTVALVGHFLLDFPWIWAFMLGFVLAAVSPAVVVPSMLLLQSDGFGVQKGIPTLLMAAGSFDDILAITGFTTCLGVAFGTGSTWMNVVKGVLEVLIGVVAGAAGGVLMHFIPSEEQSDVVLQRVCVLLGLCVFSVFGGHAAGLGGAGGLCTLVMSFIAGISWSEQKAPVAAVVGRIWNVFQPLLFGLIGAEINISSLSVYTVGLGVATLCVGLLVRVLVTFTVVLYAGFNLKEKIFISLAWMPKATVQAALGSTALDMARSAGDKQMQYYGMDVLTVAVLAILITAPIGALAMSLTGPRLLQQHTPIQHTQDQSACVSTREVDGLETKL